MTFPGMAIPGAAGADSVPPPPPVCKSGESLPGNRPIWFFDFEKSLVWADFISRTSHNQLIIRMLRRMPVGSLVSPTGTKYSGGVRSPAVVSSPRQDGWPQRGQHKLYSPQVLQTSRGTSSCSRMELWEVAR